MDGGVQAACVTYVKHQSSTKAACQWVAAAVVIDAQQRATQMDLQARLSALCGPHPNKTCNACTNAVSCCCQTCGVPLVKFFTAPLWKPWVTRWMVATSAHGAHARCIHVGEESGCKDANAMVGIDMVAMTVIGPLQWMFKPKGWIASKPLWKASEEGIVCGTHLRRMCHDCMFPQGTG